MENLYKLIDYKIKFCKEERKGYEAVVEEYFTCYLVPMIMEEILANIDITNYESFKNYSSIPVEEKIDVFKTDEDTFNYNGKHLKINKRLFKYYKEIINKFLTVNGIGFFHSIEDYDNDYFVIKTTLGKLIEVYYGILSKDEIFDAEDYVGKIGLMVSSFDNVYDTDVVSIYYTDFLNSIYKLIVSKINEIDALNYQDFDINSEQVKYTYYIRIKDAGFYKASGIDVVTSKHCYEVIKNLIKKFLQEYEIGEVGFDDTYTIEINTSLANLIYAYYMEGQRIEYFLQNNIKPKTLVKSN